MGTRKGLSLTSKSSLSFRTKNKLRRQDLFFQHKKERGKQQREVRLRRRKDEDQDPELRRKRHTENVPATQESKRVWDDVSDGGGDDDGDGRLGARIDVEKVKRRRLTKQLEAEAQQHEAAACAEASEEECDDRGQGDADDNDSMLASDKEDDNDDEDGAGHASKLESFEGERLRRLGSVAPSTTSTSIDLTPASLAAKFPNLFGEAPPPTPKILVTTSLNSTLHHEATVLCTLLPNSNYVPRSSHRYGHKYSLREICKFSANRDYTTVVMLREDLKKPTGLTIVYLPAGPTFTFSISNWMDGKKMPGHGNPTNHYPELLLNNFKTPLGLLTARLFMNLFPPRPELQGRQVVTLHNQRDFIFVRRHRYIFREKRATERNMAGRDGKDIAGVEGVRAGLQELGPRFTLRLRRVDKGVGRAGSAGENAVEWEWKGKMDKKRKAFNI